MTNTITTETLTLHPFEVADALLTADALGLGILAETLGPSLAAVTVTGSRDTLDHFGELLAT